ncbi:MAG: hypothetical protein C7B45_15785 [Sulfobacillus acidophilus]|uniref:DUF3291 domain-containing protein n=1 Tax=Sulfobacillus acidophilus TaxID=53633 RepID=A0A2T2WDE1_9FIRM|nr:MAG: hypothetical protein C7B45_15785 [Sulfobacillus acidophilus]
MTHLTIFTVGILHDPLDSPGNQAFWAQAEKIWTELDGVPGFLGQIPFDPLDVNVPLHVRPYRDRAVCTLSLWQDAQALLTFAYRGNAHAQALRKRKDYFIRIQPNHVVWYTNGAVNPTYAQGARRMDYLVQNGPTPYAFTLHHLFTEHGHPLNRAPSPTGQE